MSKFFVALVATLAVILPLPMKAFTLLKLPDPAGLAINSTGIDLLHATARTEANALLSPYSIQLALAMTYAGADGATRDEMKRVLHLPADDAQTNSPFVYLQQDLDSIVQRSAAQVARMKAYGQTADPVTIAVANRLFGQQGYDFRPAFLDSLKAGYNAPFAPMDFVKDAPGATKTINGWVADQTKQRIRDLIPQGALDASTRLVLANALYFKAPWAEPFPEGATRPLPFHIAGGAPVDVPTMTIQKSFGYSHGTGLTLVTIPYSGNEIQFLIILPDNADGLAKLEESLTADEFSFWADLPAREVKLYLPKFKIAPPTLPLGEALQTLGMTTAFNKPPGSANFDRMAPRRPNDYLYISSVFHKTFLDLDEKGTEAAAATAVAMVNAEIAQKPPEPAEVRVDHPFLFAIQHRSSGACLFLGHLVNPRMTYLK